jgi:P-aminobenzoate N-oxygenase AurF
MTRAQQIELSRQELANTLSAGIWFENILNQALLRKMMHQDPTARTTHYELTELGDETRHMVMFGKAIDRLGAKPMRPKRYQRIIINALPLTFRGSLLWVAALIGEEIFDSLQRQMMDDPELQPMVQRLMRIHVTEEARHIQFARDGLRKRAPHMRRINKMWVANLNGVGGLFFQYLFTNPAPYRRVGLDAREARRVARSSPHRHEVQVVGFAPLAAFLEEVGLMGPIARRMWKRSRFL